MKMSLGDVDEEDGNAGDADKKCCKKDRATIMSMLVSYSVAINGWIKNYVEISCKN